MTLSALFFCSPKWLPSISLTSAPDDILLYHAVRTYVMADLENACREILPGGHREGNIYVAGTVSVTIDGFYSVPYNIWSNAGSWIDFSAQQYGPDIISLFSHYTKLSYLQALRAFQRNLEIDIGSITISSFPKWEIEKSLLRCYVDPELIDEVKSTKLGVEKFVYYNEVGAPFLIAETRWGKNGEKTKIYKCLCRRKKDGLLRWLALTPPYLLPFNANRIASSPNSAVIFYETEGVLSELDSFESITSAIPGGNANISKADLSVLAGHPVHIVFSKVNLAHGLVIREKLQKVGALDLKFCLETSPCVVNFNQIEEYASAQGIALQPLLEASAKPAHLRIPKPGNLIPGGDVVRKMLLFPILKEAELIWIFADAKVGKTWMGHSIASAVASGNSTLGKWTSDTAFGVLVIDGEMSPEELENTGRMVTAGNPDAPDERNYAVLCAKSLPEGTIDLEDEETQGLIEAGLEGVNLLILDNFQSLTGNGPAALKRLRPWLRRITRSGIAIVILDHTNRDGEIQGSIEKERIADLTMSLRYPDDHAKAEGRILVEFPSPRRLYGDAADPFQLRKIFTEAHEDQPAAFCLKLATHLNEGLLPVADKIQRMAKVAYARDHEKLSYPKIAELYGIPQSTAHGDYEAAKALSGQEKVAFDSERRRLVSSSNHPAG